jgi:hypothetical protein
MRVSLFRRILSPRRLFAFEPKALALRFGRVYPDNIPHDKNCVLVILFVRPVGVQDLRGKMGERVFYKESSLPFVHFTLQHWILCHMGLY